MVFVSSKNLRDNLVGLAAFAFLMVEEVILIRILFVMSHDTLKKERKNVLFRKTYFLLILCLDSAQVEMEMGPKS